jgi:hypothetical protein
MAKPPKNRKYKVGFGKPPESTQFQKGTTGNPKGRPKGSKSVAGILAKMGRERIKVTIGGRTRSMTKLEAIVMQLSNKAASGDLRAIRDLLAAHRLFAEPTEVVEIDTASNERDKAVLNSILDRMRDAKDVAKPAKTEKKK